ncbi:hypothetical protein BLJAPNOD_01221 [Ensifer sp. M14]|nr:hypothetical protein BLJAPNOD_01221 [Ensifer sp. M14]
MTFETKKDWIMTELTPDQQIAFEAAAFRRLVAHLRERSDVQNIDLMNLAGFCRNCLSNWYRDAANEAGVPLDKEQSREIVYGMPYEEWRTLNQREASSEQKAAFEISRPKE